MSPDQTPGGWDDVVPTYERAAESLTGQYVERVLTMAGVGQGRRVLDVAAGPGALTLAAARKGAEVLGSDFAPKMVERLAQRAAESGMSNVTTQVMDGQALDAEDGSFDAVCSNFGVIFFPEPERGFREMWRVLRPGGKAAVTAWSSLERLEPMKLVADAIRRAVPDFKPAGPPVWLQFQDSSVLTQSLERAGFQSVQVETVPGSWSLPSIAWVQDNLLGMAPAIQAMFEGTSPQQKEDVLDQIGEMLAERFGESSPTLAVEAHIAVGTKGG